MAAELYIASVYGYLGYTVLWPSLTQSRYDFVLEKDGKFLRVQAKQATLREGKYLTARITTTNKNCDETYSGEIDLIAITDGKRVWQFNYAEVSSLKVLSLETSLEKRRPRSSCYNPDEALIWS